MNTRLMVATLLPGHDAHQQAAHHKVARKNQRHLGVVNNEQAVQDAGQMGKRKIAPGHARDGLSPVFALPGSKDLRDVSHYATAIGGKEGPGHDVGNVFGHGSTPWFVGFCHVLAITRLPGCTRFGEKSGHQRPNQLFLRSLSGSNQTLRTSLCEGLLSHIHIHRGIMMLTNSRKESAGQQHGRISVVLATVLVTVGVGAMALTFTPAGFPPKVAPSSLTAVTGIELPGQGYAVTGEIDVSAGAPVATATGGMAQKTVADVSPFVAQEPLSLDHSVLNNPDLLPAPNPAPTAIAAYD